VHEAGDGEGPGQVDGDADSQRWGEAEARQEKYLAGDIEQPDRQDYEHTAEVRNGRFGAGGGVDTDEGYE